MDKRISLIILSGGIGERMDLGVPKQFLVIKKNPLIYWTVKAALSSYNFDQVIIIYPHSYLNETKLALKEFPDLKYILGGTTWFDSVKIGAEASVNESVIILEAARPFFSKSNLREMCQSEHKFIVSLKKTVDAQYQFLDDEISRPISRTQVISGVTPQKYTRKFIDELAKSGQVYSDLIPSLLDNHQEFKVLFDTSMNLKLTFRNDLPLFEKLLK